MQLFKLLYSNKNQFLPAKVPKLKKTPNTGMKEIIYIFQGCGVQ